MPYLTAKLEEGPLKGIHTSQENEILYQNVLDDMEDLQLTEEDRLFVVGIAPWMYLNTDAGVRGIFYMDDAGDRSADSALL